MKLAGKAAIVTGAGRNIGEEIAVLFAQEGAKVAVVDVNAAGAEAVAAEIRAAGGVAIAVACDLTSERQAPPPPRDRWHGPCVTPACGAGRCRKRSRRRRLRTGRASASSTTPEGCRSSRSSSSLWASGTPSSRRT